MGTGEDYAPVDGRDIVALLRGAALHHALGLLRFGVPHAHGRIRRATCEGTDATAPREQLIARRRPLAGIHLAITPTHRTHFARVTCECRHLRGRNGFGFCLFFHHETAYASKTGRTRATLPILLPFTALVVMDEREGFVAVDFRSVLEMSNRQRWAHRARAFRVRCTAGPSADTR